jgi:hypothetical protein
MKAATAERFKLSCCWFSPLALSTNSCDERNLNCVTAHFGKQLAAQLKAFLKILFFLTYEHHTLTKA